MSINLIALDIGKSIGVAVLRDGEWTHHTWKLDHADWGERMTAFWDKFGDLLAWHLNPDAIVIEKSNPKVHKESQIYVGLTMMAHAVGWMSGIAREEIGATTARKAVFGKGNIDRNQILPTIKERGYAVEDKHQADALVVGLAYLERRGKKESEHDE